MQLCVIGAGVVGLTTALELQKEYRNATVTIVADRFEQDTCSDVAAGLFRPGTSFCGPTEDITRKWISDAYRYWDDIRKTEDASDAGVAQLSGYIFSSTDPAIVRNHYIEKVLPLYRPVTEQELTLCPGEWKYGSFFTTVLTECRLFQPWATKRFLRQGGRIVTENLEGFHRLTGKFSAVVNCSGLGAKKLCNDYKLVPIRGQVIKVKASWVKTAFYADYDTYIIPGFQGVTLGGCRNFDSYNTNLCRHDSAAIRERCEALLPSLKGAPVIREAVGLRPHRDPVRVEPEWMQFPSGTLKVIHNYGHGGYGVTTAPGTAIYATQLLTDLLKSNSKL
ncbi:D-aspartate oxidase [Sabethes cyaneus]|uniref:D-aspartate oxidase n=1 Tax=Sabethes cyaneus TaxID=53552 RepID=UPI00237E779D|nr:D-aspartate oxidase [Sabethes cyaneus]XP_053685416.1 D-aspartate oxidase [Sabethes cyaneus]XP_053685417.1 D-aspartate oxidase [Sabethes cyaneus]XP_053685418.1 D-aspartate oxidase [Sabethes cyaneus]